ncbi:MAG TPA: hypothetical protein VJU59_03935, partial [Paraburkholderia sp.]|uniref:hypothetical protein n=1 Tax=Paraburkholderia sp. TaxID=1926495 RepID=UPI002B460636
ANAEKSLVFMVGILVCDGWGDRNEMERNSSRTRRSFASAWERAGNEDRSVQQGSNERTLLTGATPCISYRHERSYIGMDAHASKTLPI